MASPLFSDGSDFCWAAGIEDTFIRQSRPGLRPLDEYELTQHYQFWDLDFSLAASLGVRALRWGIPWYRVQPEPGRFDWGWTDRALERLVEVHKIVPIIDLMHYGTPLWLEDSFASPDYPTLVAEYAGAVARRYAGLVSVFTPLNEPTVNADYCGRKGVWPPYLQGDEGFVRVLLAIARGILLTTEALRSEQPGCTLVQVEALWHHWTASPTHQKWVAMDNLSQFLALDLCTGRVNGSHPLAGFLKTNGAKDTDLEGFLSHPARFDILGGNFYPWSYGELAPDEAGRLTRIGPPTPGAAIREVLLKAYERYQQPLMVTETSARGSVEVRRRWMDETIATVFALRSQGIPVLGYTWFPMMTMIEWEYRTGTGPLEEYLLHLGLFDSHLDEAGILRRSPTPLADAYRKYTNTPVAPLHRGI